MSIEDPLAEDDKDGMIAFTKRFGDQLQIIGDDYLVTNDGLVRAAPTSKAANAVLIKVNQIGTVSEAVSYNSLKGGLADHYLRGQGKPKMSQSAIWQGLGAGQLKVGSFQRSERMVKWNECLRIQDQLGADQFVAGQPLLNSWWGKHRKRPSSAGKESAKRRFSQSFR